MGHSRLGLLPQTFDWQDVIALIASGGAAAVVAEATIRAASEALDQAAKDPGVRHVFHLLTQLALAAAAEGDFADSLQDAGVVVPDGPSMFDIVAGFSEAVDDHLLATRRRTDFGEMAQMAAAESLASLIAAESAGLYGTTTVEVRSAMAHFSTDRGFAQLSEGFFSRLIERFLTYHLSRELSAHVGGGRRFADMASHEEFGRQLRTTCEETSVIVKRFAGEWHGKTMARDGFTREKVRDFVHGAIQKIRSELQVRGGGTHVTA